MREHENNSPSTRNERIQRGFRDADLSVWQPVTEESEVDAEESVMLVKKGRSLEEIVQQCCANMMASHEKNMEDLRSRHEKDVEGLNDHIKGLNDHIKGLNGRINRLEEDNSVLMSIAVNDSEALLVRQIAYAYQTHASNILQFGKDFRKTHAQLKSMANKAGGSVRNQFQTIEAEFLKRGINECDIEVLVKEIRDVGFGTSHPTLTIYGDHLTKADMMGIIERQAKRLRFDSEKARVLLEVVCTIANAETNFLV